MNIHLTDNNQGKDKDALRHKKEITSLFPLAEKTIAQLCRENENLLIFPYSLEESDDQIGSSSILSLNNTSDPEKVVLTTGNIMGFIGVKGLQIKIKSRFDQGRDDYLLHYMLQKVFSFNLFDLNHSHEQEEIFDFLMFVFPYFLKRALRQGVYREYKNHKRNDTAIKGTVDIGRHVAKNTPFVGQIAYTSREYSHDNYMTQLIRHTIEFMRTKKYGEAVLHTNRETMENVQTILEHTSSYNSQERNYILHKNLRPKRHPYYTAYEPLQHLCLQILRMETIKYGDREDEICGILFDGAWLWEEYVYTLLRHHGFKHPENKKGKKGIYLFDDKSGVRYPDFYKDDFVLDAKYKRLGNCKSVSEVDRNDIHQIISYLACLQAKKGGFIAPLEKAQTEIPTKTVRGILASLSIFGIEISKNTNSYADFYKEMAEKENVFLDQLWRMEH